MSPQMEAKGQPSKQGFLRTVVSGLCVHAFLHIASLDNEYVSIQHYLILEKLQKLFKSLLVNKIETVRLKIATEPQLANFHLSD